MTYSHRQTSRLMRALTAAPVILMLAGITFALIHGIEPPAPSPDTPRPPELPPVALPAFGLMLLLFIGTGLVFSSLTVEVDHETLSWHFGLGRFRRAIPLTDIVSAEQVRNELWYGWGIRWIPGGRLYNIAGLDAVELKLSDGRMIRLGSDEVDGLLAAIHAGMKATSPG